jgi:hypothetical protein
MTDFDLSAAIAAIVFLSGVIGLNLHRILPEWHQTKETQDVIRLGTGMLSVLASLVLGLLISTVKTSFDGMNSAVRSYSADLTMLDDVLRDYGDGALPARRLLRDYTTRLLNDAWSVQEGHAFLVENREAGTILEHAYALIRALTPANHDQQLLEEQALQLAATLLRERWLLIEQSGPTVQPVVIAILVAWIAAIFVSFGMNAPRHATIYATFLVLSVALGSAMFMILELDSPFEGVLRLSSQPVQTALTHMLPPDG